MKTSYSRQVYYLKGFPMPLHIYYVHLCPLYTTVMLINLSSTYSGYIQDSWNHFIKHNLWTGLKYMKVVTQSHKMFGFLSHLPPFCLVYFASVSMRIKLVCFISVSPKQNSLIAAILGNRIQLLHWPLRAFLFPRLRFGQTFSYNTVDIDMYIWDFFFLHGKTGYPQNHNLI